MSRRSSVDLSIDACKPRPNPQMEPTRPMVCAIMERRAAHLNR
jgi:hypothetical protein